jgi:hypothetical protein
MAQTVTKCDITPTDQRQQSIQNLKIQNVEVSPQTL